MKFPTIGEIATTSVVSIDIDNTISDAMKVMFSHDHRNIVVIDGDTFRILKITDILNMKIQKIDPSSSLRDLELSIVPVANRNKNVLHTLEYLNCDVEYICALNDDGSLYGLISHSDITSSIDPDTLMGSFCLNDFLKLGKRVKWIGKEMKTSTLLNEMVENSFESVMIVENFIPVGIFTTKDVIRIIKNGENLELPISEYMSSPIDTINKNCSIKEALDFLKEKHYKRVVVVDDDGRMAGIITQKELISLAYSKWAVLMKEHHEELNQINAALLKKSKKYEEMASTDPLTGLYNRYKFSELYLALYKDMLEIKADVSLIILDIDYFKKINDTHGHNIGDTVLIQVSKVLLKNLRDVDIVCRWGGEEFVLLLPKTNLNNAIMIAEKQRVIIQELHIESVGGVTASFGVAKVMESDDLKSVVDRADEALYLAKKLGRNCTKSQNDILH